MWTPEQRLVRDLAKQVKELSQTPEKLDIIERYKAINSLKPCLPPIRTLVPQKAMLALTGLYNLEAQDPYLRNLELDFKMKLLRGEAVGDDMPVTDSIYSGFAYQVTEWMDGYHTVRIGENLESAHFEPCILEDADFFRLSMPKLSIDRTATEENFRRLNDLLGDILTVIRGQPFSSVIGWGESMVDQLVEMRGLQQFYYDMVDRPELVHAAMEFMTQGHLALLDRFREEGLFVSNSGENSIGSSSPGFSAELPGDCIDAGRIQERNLWGFAQAQELSEVSPGMLEEFVLPYQARIINRFGLSTYGCCEAMEHRIDTVSRYMKNLRMISVSPHTNTEAAAEKCRGKYVFAWKPQPSFMIDFDEEIIEAYLRRTLQFTRGCCLTINLGDALEYGNQPERFRKWTKIARRALEIV